MLPQRSVTCLAMMFIIMGSLVTVADDPPRKADDQKKPGFTISKETTYVTGPLREGGYIDYVAALNERMKQGVTPENNAMVLLVRALGPAPEGYLLPDSFFKELGCPVPPKEGTYFRELEPFLKETKKPAIADDQSWDYLQRLSSRPWSRKDFPDAASWVDANSEPLRWALSASQRTKCYTPATSKTQNGEYRTVFNVMYGRTFIRSLGQLMLCRAMLRCNEGQLAEAKADILACHRLARLASQGAADIHLLEGMSLETLAIQAATSWLQQPDLPVQLVQEYQRELSALEPISPIHAKVDGAERLHMLDTLMLVSQHGFKYLEGLAGGSMDQLGVKMMDMLLFKDLNWDPALKKANAWHDRMVASLKNTDRNERVRAAEEIENEMKALRKQLATELPSRIAKSKESRVLAAYDMARCLLTTAIFKVQISVDRVEQQQRHLQLAIALALHHRDKGQYPEKLNELCPKYLPTIPLDLFSGKDVVYSRTAKGYRLYSVGPNGKDDGGVKDEDHPPKADDILLEVPLPEWKK